MTEAKRKNAVKDFFYGYDDKVSDKIDEAIALSCLDAKELPSPLDGERSKADKPLTVHVGGRAERWTSRFLCYHFYNVASMACGGSSEGVRYREVADGVYHGDGTPTDGLPLRRKATRKAA